MKLTGTKTSQFVQIISLFIGGFSISIACLTLIRVNKNAKLLKKINQGLISKKRLITINSDQWVSEKIAMRKAIREVTLPKAKKRFLTG